MAWHPAVPIISTIRSRVPSLEVSVSRSNPVELMRNPLMNNSIRVATLAGALLLSPMLGCTDLTEVPKSAITPDQFYKNESEIVAGLASVYASMQQVVQNGY